MLSIIIPAHNEENYVGACLDAVIAQDGLPPDHGVQLIVAANGCRDRTVEICEDRRPALEAAGFDFDVLQLPDGNKIRALNAADAEAVFDARAYLDADVIISPGLVSELSEILEGPDAVYASGTLEIPRSPSWFTRAYARVWTRFPFVRDGVPGIGLFAVNAAGRARWPEFPPIIADDRFVRLNFKEHERHKTKATYLWPLPDGFWNMVNVRHRWTEGNAEVLQSYPELVANDGMRNKSAANAASLLKTPVASAVFVAIFVIGQLLALKSKGRGNSAWNRGRI